MCGCSGSAAASSVCLPGLLSPAGLASRWEQAQGFDAVYSALQLGQIMALFSLLGLPIRNVWRPERKFKISILAIGKTKGG